MNKHESHAIRKIRSFRELEREKARLKMEIVKTESNIKGKYRHLLDALTFRNLFHTVAEDIALTSSVFSKAYEIGKNIFGRRKKKKKKKNEQVPAGGKEQGPATDNEPGN
jgi:hypothetical protein